MMFLPMQIIIPNLVGNAVLKVFMYSFFFLYYDPAQTGCKRTVLFPSLLTSGTAVCATHLA